jgi:hypothetical protein
MTNPNVTQHLRRLELMVLNLIVHPLKTEMISLDKVKGPNMARGGMNSLFKNLQTTREIWLVQQMA